jgi:hypothetical protein
VIASGIVMSNPFMLAVGPGGQVERGGELALRFRDASGADVWIWTSHEPTIPAFWTSLFARDDIELVTSSVPRARGLETLERRRSSWKAKASPAVFRGYEAFVRWVSEHPADTIVLDVAQAAETRRQPFADATRQLIAFIDDEEKEPGPLLSGWDERVGWKARKGQLKLECFYRDVAWPGDVPHFQSGPYWVMAATMGDAPFRQGAWPEHRFTPRTTDALLSPHREAVNARATEARELIGTCPVPAPRKLEAKTFGNPTAVAQTRARWKAFLERAKRYAEEAPSFARTRQVFDDGPLWRERIQQTEELMKELERVEKGIEAAMRAFGQ